MPAAPHATPSPPAALELQGLVKDFAVGLRGVKLRAVDQLNLRVESGQVYGLLGPNGSGKSTTIKMILGLLAPTAGACRIFGVASTQVEARSAVGYLPESPNFYRHLSGRELVRVSARMCGMGGPGVETARPYCGGAGSVAGMFGFARAPSLSNARCGRRTSRASRDSCIRRRARERRSRPFSAPWRSRSRRARRARRRVAFGGSRRCGTRAPTRFDRARPRPCASTLDAGHSTGSRRPKAGTAP